MCERQKEESKPMLAEDKQEKNKRHRRLCRAGWSSEVATVPLGSGGCGGMEETVRVGSQAGKRGQEVLDTDRSF